MHLLWTYSMRVQELLQNALPYFGDEHTNCTCDHGSMGGIQLVREPVGGLPSPDVGPSRAPLVCWGSRYMLVCGSVRVSYPLLPHTTNAAAMYLGAAPALLYLLPAMAGRATQN